MKTDQPNIEPWLIGIVDSFSGAKLLLNSSLSSKERLALILIDSALEIAFKEYLVRKCNIKFEEAWSDRKILLKVIKGKAPQIKEEEFDHLSFFHEERNPLLHKSAAITLNPELAVQLFQLSISVVERLFGVELQPLIKEPKDLMPDIGIKRPYLTNNFKRDVDVIIAAVRQFQCSDYKTIEENIKKMGYPKEIKSSLISTIVRHKSYRHYFYFDSVEKLFRLTDVGEDEFLKIVQGEEVGKWKRKKVKLKPLKKRGKRLAGSKLKFRPRSQK